MGVFETVARMVQQGGAPERAAEVSILRAEFEVRTGAFAPEDPWFEERSRAFWCDAVTDPRFGAQVADALRSDERSWLGPLRRAHRGLFRAEGRVLVDVWSGAELVVDAAEDESWAELEAGVGQRFDGRVVGLARPPTVALLPGAIFHPHNATQAIDRVLVAARAGARTTGETLDALLRMERTLRALSRVKAAYAYRPEALATGPPSIPVRIASREPK